LIYQVPFKQKAQFKGLFSFSSNGYI